MFQLGILLVVAAVAVEEMAGVHLGYALVKKATEVVVRTQALSAQSVLLLELLLVPQLQLLMALVVVVAAREVAGIETE